MEPWWRDLARIVPQCCPIRTFYESAPSTDGGNAGPDPASTDRRTRDNSGPPDYMPQRFQRGHMQTSRRAPVRSSITLLLGVAALSLAAIAPAQAQYFDPFVEVISPRSIVWRLNDRGFTEISRPRFDGRAYVVEAESPRGGRVRLFVDARDGAVLGRVRLDAPLLPPARIGRPGNVYGWTEGDVAARRGEDERPIPPGNIPSARDFAPRSPLRGTEADRAMLDRAMPDRFAPDRSGTSGRTDPGDPNALGLNPDAGRRNPEAPRKIVRLPPQAKPAASKARERGPEAARTVPPAPALRPAEAEPPAAKPEQPVAAIEAPKAAPTPAAVQPPPVEGTASAAEAKTSEAKPPAQAWKDPPAENKRPVRVIDGATVVPGSGDKGSPGTE